MCFQEGSEFYSTSPQKGMRWAIITMVAFALLGGVSIFAVKAVQSSDVFNEFTSFEEMFFSTEQTPPLIEAVIDGNYDQLTYPLGIAAIVSLFMVAFRKDKRSVHDFIAGTYVTHEKPNQAE